MDKNQAPITKPTAFLGDSFVIIERPTGERFNSPMVWNKYINTKNTTGTNPSVAKYLEPNTIKANPAANSESPKTNFIGVEGSFPLFLSFIHIQENTGASSIINKELKNW